MVTWATPVAGTYAVTVIARDTATGSSGQGVYTITIKPATAPLGTSASISGQTGTALSFTATFQASNPLTYSMTGAPTGMTLNASTGQVSWAAPVLGTYAVKISASPISGTAGKAVSGTISISDPGASYLQISITGIPWGMTFAMNGSTSVNMNWAAPVAANYTLAVTVIDNLGRMATKSIPISIQ